MTPAQRQEPTIAAAGESEKERIVVGHMQQVDPVAADFGVLGKQGSSELTPNLAEPAGRWRPSR